MYLSRASSPPPSSPSNTRSNSESGSSSVARHPGHAAEVARKVAATPSITERVRCLFAFASHEEIGRFGSRVLAQELRPDVLIAVDVNHDYDTAPTQGKERYQPLKL